MADVLRFFASIRCSTYVRLVLPLVLVLTSCSPSMRFTSVRDTQLPTTHFPDPTLIQGIVLMGQASYYGDEFDGRMTSNGEIFDQNRMTAAHRTLPFGTILRVTNLRNNRSVVVRINDRGPFSEGRIIDLSRAAAEKLDMIREGIARVSIAVLN